MSEFTVLVVDDSPFMRKLVGDLIASDSAFKVVATAADGAEAVDRVCGLRPDIVIMDLEMPAMNGLEALKLIMTQCPTPVVMMSAVTDRGTRDTIRALQFGAFDFVRKPDGALKLDVSQMGEMLIEKLHMARELVASGALRLRRMPEAEAEARVEAQDETPAAGDDPPSADRQSRTVADTPAGTSASGGDPLGAAGALARAETAAAGPPPRDADAPPSAPAVMPPTAEQPDKRPPPRRSLEELRAFGRTSGPQAPGERPARRPPGAQDEANRTKRPAGGPAGAAKDGAAAMPPLRPGPRRADAAPEALPPEAAVLRAHGAFTDIVAIGTSTGGPRALHEVMSAIPASFPAPILIVQHMPPKFTHSLAQRLDSCSAIEVREAEDGDRVVAGHAYLAPGGKHMRLQKDPHGGYRIALSEDQPVSGHRPSVDVMFDSLVGRRELRRHVVLMTGMGSDGARAMKALRDDGAALLIAEAEETCVVYGMPRSAVENGAAQAQFPLQQIAPELIRSVERPRAKQH
ncbi:chemotaxis protein CheB [Cohnella sp. 56]|uniref:chemotaxis protein CheB n=1 Tax=Cohnella sp. 56 TaxID=3113722 RepID=UPI0030EA7E80